jgi:hypothetical protein
MENAQDIAAQIAAVREQFERLAGPIESSKGQAEAFADALAQLGVQERSSQAKAIAEKVEEHQALRAAIAGGLAKAHWLMLSVINGTMGPGASGPTSSVIDNEDGTTSWHGKIDGIKTEIVYGHQPEVEPGPNGQELVDEAQPRSRFGRATQTMVKDDASDPAKFTGQTIENLSKAIRADQADRPSSSSTESSHETNWIAEIVQPPTAEVRAVPGPTVGLGNIFELSAVGAVVLMKTGQSLGSSMSNLKSRLMKERKHGDQDR